jgi:hypothetical protein
VNRVYEPDPPVITSANLDNYVQMSMPDSLWLPTTLPAPELRKLFGVS